MKTMITFFKAVVVIICCGVSSHLQAQAVNTQDSLALVDLYNSTNGSQWTKHTNWLTSKPVNTWYGIAVSANRVTEVDLINNNLAGKIPSSIGQLTSATYLRLSINNLSDTIPALVGNLINLTDLVLDINSLTGSIPSSIGNLGKLQQLELSTNQLSGIIPSSIGNLTELNTFDAGINQLSGRIPSSIVNLVNLEFLLLFDNQLKGPIPSGIGSLKKLISLNLSDNQLSGEIPLSLLNINTLQYVQLEDNKLTNEKGTVYPPVPPHKNVQLNVSGNKLNFDILQFLDTTFTGPNVYTYGQAFLKIHQYGNMLSVYAGGTLSANTYFWQRAGKLVATIPGDSTFHPSVPGLYSVFIQNSIADETLNSYNYYFTGTANDTRSALTVSNQVSQGLIIYPNPVKDVLHVRMTGNANVIILTVTGQVIISKKINGNGDINVSALKPGVYYLKDISTNEQQRFIISK